MGRDGFPVYGEDIGSAIEAVEKIIANIKTNKYDKEDLAELVEAVEKVKAVIEANED